jgi:hypothetical protein
VLLDAPISSLSSAVAPFFPGCMGRRSKSRWWTDGDDEESDDDHPVTCLEAACRMVKPALESPVHPRLVLT